MNTGNWDCGTHKMDTRPRVHQTWPCCLGTPRAVYDMRLHGVHVVGWTSGRDDQGAVKHFGRRVPDATSTYALSNDNYICFKLPEPQSWTMRSIFTHLTILPSASVSMSMFTSRMHAAASVAGYVSNVCIHNASRSKTIIYLAVTRMTRRHGQVGTFA